MNDNIKNNAYLDRNYVRLTDFDYSLPGAYFVTICSHNKQCIFDDIERGEMHLNSFGKIAQKCWGDLPLHYDGVVNDIFIMMPNHVHGILIIPSDNGRSGSHISLEAEYLRKPDPTKKYPLHEIVRAFKTYSSRNINELRHSPGTVVWQRSFYEHVIRSDKEYRKIGEYITYNVAKWDIDTENPNINTINQ